MTDYVGARWLKCDFHLHTPASECFKDKSVTADQWVQSCLEQKLDCVAVTDHNTHEWVDDIKAAAEGTNLTVFPGVELTCDTSKVHLLVLFDADKVGQDVYDFLIGCGIRREFFSSSEAQSNLSCLDVIDKAKEAGALVIPAHIDEFNGLGLLSKRTIGDFLKNEDILAAQFVTPQFKSKGLVINDEFGKEYNNKYGRAEGSIGLQEIKDYYACVQECVRNNLALVTFSDNPDNEEPSKHGLTGIGKSYTWIKMDKSPSLEGIRQALMVPDRVRNCFDSIAVPYKEPSLWIKSIEVRGTTLTKDPFKIDFNPQLNTIIGGRGSGKSSVFRFLRGAFHKMNDLSTLKDIKEEQDKFFQKPNEENGVLKDETEIVVELVRDGIPHIVEYSLEGRTKVLRQENEQWVEVMDDSYIKFFDFEQYTQKQVFSIAKNTNALRELIDSGTDEIAQLMREKESLVQSYVSAYKRLKTAKSHQPRINELDTEIKDLKLKIDNLKNSDITAIAQKQALFLKQHERIENHFLVMQKAVEQLRGVAQKSVFPVFDVDGFDEAYRDGMLQIFEPLQKSSSELASSITDSLDRLANQIGLAYQNLQDTAFETDRLAHNETYERKKKELQERGIDDINNYQAYTEKLKVKENEQKELVEITSKIPQYEQEILGLRQSIYNRQAEITQKRQDIVNGLSTNKVKINVRKMSDSKKFEFEFRSIVQKDRRYGDDFDIITAKCFPQKPVDFEKEYQTVMDDIHNIASGKDSSLGFGGWFVRMVRELDDEQMSKLETLVPDDQIDVLYKPNGSSSFRSIVSASAGQKTTAVLTYILSQGSMPLLLDQPEDDLDNRLVCDLVVEKIKQIKENRQVIVITHNANIPVIGDAEYIVSMDSNSKYLKIHTEGMLESVPVKKEICEIMEGGEDAFKLRALRYKTIFK